MKRRKVLKSMALSAMAVPALHQSSSTKVDSKVRNNAVHTVFYNSPWHNLPDMVWIGESFWANRLQDWEIRGGELLCNICDKNRTAHLLTYQLNDIGNFVQTSIQIKVNEKALDNQGLVGFQWGSQGRFDDYRSAALTGKGLVVGIDTQGLLHLDDMVSHKPIEQEYLSEGVELKFYISSDGHQVQADLSVWYKGSPISTLRKNEIPIDQAKGNIALYSHFDKPQKEDWSVSYSKWDLSGDLLTYDESHNYGPIYFTQYTQELGVLKLTAQLAVLPESVGPITMSIKQGDDWKVLQEQPLVPGSYTAHFRLEDWDGTVSQEFKIHFTFEDNNGHKTEYNYIGQIAEEPVDVENVKVLALSCNWDLGFPDLEFGKNASSHDAHIAVFLGDQFYEANAGFGVQMFPADKAALDYLRKWYLFGWAHRDLFRNRPSICLPDDHDVYHGNVWGEGGKATIAEGGAAERQDTGGYKMPGEWVNIVQTTQTSHMPDAYDPTPVLQGISVFYTSWKYGGIDFGIIEDRKFKSAPKNIFPPEAEVFNGYVQNRDFDWEGFKDDEHAELLGERQMAFLEEWIGDWTDKVEMKVLLSATSFMTMQTLPEGSNSDKITPKLPIPKYGEYVTGDYFTRDMDSNGWPQKKRDEIVRILRKGYVTHVVGDQHLASVAQYGVENFRDSNFAFTVPAIASVWPRRWWPPIPEQHRPLPGRKQYTGDFFDGFGNRLTVFSAGNPTKLDKTPALLYDRATGYGVVHLNKTNRRIRFECWDRFTNPIDHPQGQYDDWPVEISQYDNFASHSNVFLPTIEVKGLDRPVVKIYQADEQTLVSAVRLHTTTFAFPVLASGKYLVKIGDPDQDHWVERVLDTDEAGEVVVVEV
ncbi:alkaline phosphatase D family protein [Membranihabitans marinus]|uniref:alkaline phosphatase D family protein n=1 Tax=Membranihabitans marinus TaxID=1227546 RepID=UPI001F26DAA0|nr:alkaline phosphatase D family protein [Membranihabitans marinus]